MAGGLILPGDATSSQVLSGATFSSGSAGFNATGTMPTPGVTTFSYTGAVQSWTVPTGVTTITVDMTGAQGGDSYNGSLTGGLGARLQFTYTVVPGTEYDIYIGGAGEKSEDGGSSQPVKNAGWPDGGNGGRNYDTYRSPYDYPNGGGGGGSSFIVPHGTSETSAFAQAGGGGGSSACQCNGGNGGLNGIAGGNNTAGGQTANGGGGGTQSGGGGGGAGAGGSWNGSNGGPASGGAGAGNNVTDGNNPGSGGGGGGGYYGGGGGGSNASYGADGGGGGGSSLAPSGTTVTSGYQRGNGYITISW